ncbi:MAG TPA: FdrA family protein [Streptosporangiaceae bacterium]|nr:FdrA family protein [Streptosporangiaceae bacterium]
MSVEHVEARPGAYADSVTLMQVSADVRQADGVQAALIAMATELNLDLLVAMGFQPPPGAEPNRLLVAVRATDDIALSSAIAAVDTALSARPARGRASTAGAQAPRTTAAAVRASGPGLALISVPGQYAFGEAMDALDAGCDVMIFSDNMPVEQEIVLKDIAAQRDLIVMGPDCGTSIVGGVGLGFSHTLAAGPVGLVAASGTGAQQVLCLLDQAGAGVSAALGVGGRDLSAAVGGRSARAALAALDADPDTELIIVVSKPPAADVAAQLRVLADGLATPVQFALVAPGEPDLTAAAETALRALGLPVPAWPRWPGTGTPPRPGVLRGLFAGGTLCDEAMVIASERLGAIRSNVPLRPEWRLAPRTATTGHAMVDFGDDELTAGRAHPMIDQSLRLERLAADAADPVVTAILLDVVLGHAAHPDPAAELGPAIAAARASGGVAVVASLIGAASDPQDLARQAATLQAAGAHVFASNAAAARFACDLAGGVR